MTSAERPQAWPAEPEHSLVWGPGRPCSVDQLLAPLRRGRGDPTYRIDANRRHWRGVRTPEGPATLLIEQRRLDEIRAAAWGPGGRWAINTVPALLGAEDDPSGFEPDHHALVAEAWRQHRHLRIGRTGLVLEALVPAIIEQKITTQEAFGGFRRLVCRFGERAPGPAIGAGDAEDPGRQLWVQPAAGQLASIPSWEWLKLHIDPARSRPIVQAARVADSIERLVSVSAAEADRRLRSLPGVGIWTSAEVRARALGDPDAVSFGDYHVAKNVGWAMLGHDIDDAELADVLEPWRGHRGRVVTLLGLAGARRPRRGPRMSPRRHLPR
ncbi:MAG: DNA-3-methyladenine glycosylase family protein [Nocardioides sp.]